MSKNKERNSTMVNYDGLGTVSERELIDAIIDDILIMKEKHGVRFYTGAKLIIRPTNEHGDPVMARRGNGAPLKWFNTTHFRPACLDYDL